jgi:hypothetical protein
MKHGFSILMLVVISLLLGLVAFLAVRLLGPLWENLQRVEVPCLVKSVSVDHNPRSLDSGGKSRLPVIVYEYQVGGRTYTSDTYCPFPMAGMSRSRAGKIINGLKPGQRRTCWVSRNNPADAVWSIEAGPPIWQVVGLLLPAFLVTGALAWVVLWSRGVIRRRPWAESLVDSGTPAGPAPPT